ncbi:endonuclease/exonuclease/phosphatase family protein [Candidatus Dojkabacteria bacterium]|nr:endonuclease/exonuclease/phosphatase family protein [Candidatus Dojkabacteria bacterium]
MELKIFSLNCWLLPPPFSINNQKRLNNIVSTIKVCRPDIIALQEIWLNRYIKEIEERLQGYSFVKSNSSIINKSGLLTGIRKEAADFEVNYFPQHSEYGLFEKIARKGYHTIKLNEDLSFINTHLYCSRAMTGELIKKTQFKFLQKLFPTQKVILGGDLNINEKLLAKLNTRFVYDKSQGSTVSYTNALTRARFNRFGVPDHKVDYILISKDTGASITTRYIKNPIVSDHYMLLSDVKIT